MPGSGSRPLVVATIVEPAEYPSLAAGIATLPEDCELRQPFLVVLASAGMLMDAHGAETLRDAVRLLFAMRAPGARVLLALKVADRAAAVDAIARYLEEPARRYDA